MKFIYEKIKIMAKKLAKVKKNVAARKPRKNKKTKTKKEIKTEILVLPRMLTN